MIHLHNPSDNESALADLMPDLTPMLDILFILLVFFMLSAGAVFQSLDLTLPSSVTEALAVVNEPKHIMLEIRAHDYTVDGQATVDFEQLQKSIAKTVKEKSEHEVIIAGDKDISIERLLKVLTYLQSQGIQTANILMQKEQ
ncbi:MAG: ExbD/TolR family protein [Methylotenera sp.]|jgi:biopolymer transport protein ExbD